MLHTKAASSIARVVVAIPVRDEEERIGACLAAIGAQVGRQADDIVLLVNNTTDRSVAVARKEPLPAGTRLHIREVTLPPRRANAGHTRGLAMSLAADLAGDDGVIITTDADGRVDDDWVEANIAAICRGADAVAGWVDLDPAEWAKIPMALHEDDARECAYDLLCDEIHARLDPDPNDPWPRHTQASGASIGVTVRAFRAVGGVPAVASGEDRAFLAALRRIDAVIRHDLACHVAVSGRLIGRAPGGMADTIRRRLATPDLLIDDRLEPAASCAMRAAARRYAGECWRDQAKRLGLCALLGLPSARYPKVLEAATLGACWAALEQSSPLLRRRRVAVAELERQTREAAAIVGMLRSEQAPGAVLHSNLVATGS